MPRNHIIKINQGRILPLWLRLVLTSLIVSGVFLAFERLDEHQAILLVLPISLALPPIWSGFRITEVNLTSSTAIHYKWIMGIKWRMVSLPLAMPLRFQIKESTDVQDDLSRLRPVRHHRKYTCYLKGSDGKLVFLISEKSYEKLLKRLNPLVKKTGLEVYK